jgi:hypothetical protein
MEMDFGVVHSSRRVWWWWLLFWATRTRARGHVGRAQTAFASPNFLPLSKISIPARPRASALFPAPDSPSRRPACRATPWLTPRERPNSIMSAEKRAASESFGNAQIVKRKKSDSNLGSEVAVVNGSAQNGALIQAVRMHPIDRPRLC